MNHHYLLRLRESMYKSSRGAWPLLLPSLQPRLSRRPPLPLWPRGTRGERSTLPSVLVPKCWESSRASLLGHERKPLSNCPLDSCHIFKKSMKSSHNMLWAWCPLVGCEMYRPYIWVSIFQESITQFISPLLSSFCLSFELFTVARELKEKEKLGKKIKQKLDPFAIC